MIVKVKIDKRGRVTLPKAMRDELGIRKGEDFDFAVIEKRIFVTRRSDQLTFEMVVLPDTPP